MTSFDLLLAVGVLALAVGVGTVVHELLHAGVLAAAGVPYTIQWLQGGPTGRLGAGLVGTWASVRMQSVPQDLPPWQLRVASLSPLALALPLVAIAVGVVPDPFVGDDLVLQFAVIGWLACALPSPSDFSLVWHAEDVIDDADVV